MQTLRTPSLLVGTASVSRNHIAISGKAVCCGCGGESFEIAIYGDGSTEAICLNGSCRKFWPPTGEEQEQDASIPEAVGDGGNEPSDVVRAASEAAQQGEVASFLAEVTRSIDERFRAKAKQ